MTVCRSLLARAAALGIAAAFFFAGAAPARAVVPPPPGGPILVVTSGADGFSRYLPEILRGEGLNEFDVADVGSLSPGLLAGRGVVVLGSTPLSADQAATLTAWVQAGGNLVAIKPSTVLAPLLGLASAGGAVSNASVLAAPGSGVTGTAMQFHGAADLYTLNGANAVATLADAGSASGLPAVTLRNVGSAGGQTAAFTYDLPQSVVLTRQGNPAWIDQERDNASIDPAPGIRRSDDLFFGGSEPDWVDLDRVQVPSADEQQRLLANLIIGMQQDRMPLPRFWYLPQGLKAAVVMTGDDHANSVDASQGQTEGTVGQFTRYQNVYSAPGCSVADWQCVRSTSYLFPGANISDQQVANFQAAGFEVGLHLWNSGLSGGATNVNNQNCNNATLQSTAADLSLQLNQFAATWPSAARPVTSRSHCIVWSGWVNVPTAELGQGIRLDTNYYYWPGAWLKDRPGLFTGSGLPQRFADTGGALVDVYQATTQLTDESGQNIPNEIAVLLDNAIGGNGFYAVVTANMHTDTATSNHPDANAIIEAAQARGVPVVSARQMLTWLDGREGSSFTGLSMNGGQLSFAINPAGGARGLTAMLPLNGPTGGLLGLARNGANVPYGVQNIKGIDYAMFDAAAGSYVATYPAPGSSPSGTPPIGGTGASRTPKVKTVEVLKRATLAPTFPRLKISTTVLRPGGGRSLAITFRLKHTSRIVLSVRDAKGKVVRRIRATKHKAHTVLRLRWDGRDSKGRYVKPGRYRFAITATGKHYQKTAHGSVRVLAATS
jgi:FlgD Ig-like domain